MSSEAYDFSPKARTSRVLEDSVRKLGGEHDWNACNMVARSLLKIKLEKGERAYEEALNEAATTMGFNKEEIGVLSCSILIHEDFMGQARHVVEKLETKYL